MPNNLLRVYTKGQESSGNRAPLVTHAVTERGGGIGTQGEKASAKRMVVMLGKVQVRTMTEA